MKTSNFKNKVRTRRMTALITRQENLEKLHMTALITRQENLEKLHKEMEALNNNTETTAEQVTVTLAKISCCEKEIEILKEKIAIPIFRTKKDRSMRARVIR